MLTGILQLLRRYFTFLAYAVMALGTVTGQWHMMEGLKLVIPVNAFFILFPPMLGLSFAEFSRVRGRRGLITAVIALNLFVVPLLMYAVIRLLPYRLAPEIAGCMLLYAAIPFANVLLFFTRLARGDAVLAVQLLVLGFLGNLVLVPFWLKYLIGVVLPVPVAPMIKGFMLVVGIPLAAAIIVRTVILRRRGEAAFEAFRKGVAPLASLALLVFLFVVMHLNGRLIFADPVILAKVALPVIGLHAVMLTVVTVAGRLLGLSRAERAATGIATAAKNTSTSITLAALLLSPASALAVTICGPMAQFPSLLVYSRLMNRMAEKGDKEVKDG